MHTDDHIDQQNIQNENRFTKWLGQNTHLVSLGQRLPLLQLRRPENNGQAINMWVSRITSPINNLAGYIHGKFQRASLSGRPIDSIHWLSRSKKLNDNEIKTEQVRYPGEFIGRIGSESSIGQHSSYDTSGNVLPYTSGDSMGGQAQPEGFSVYDNRGSGNESSYPGILSRSISNTQKMLEETGQRRSSLNHTRVQSNIRDHVESLTENRLYHENIIENKSGLPEKRDIRSEIQASSLDYIPQNRDIPYDLEKSSYPIQKDPPYLKQSDLSDSQVESAESVDASEIPLSKQSYTSETYSPIPSPHPSNVAEIIPDRFNDASPATSAAHKKGGVIPGETGSESEVAEASATKETARSKQGSSNMSAKLPVGRLIQAKAADHIERLTHIPQRISKKTTSTFTQAQKPLSEQVVSARGDSPENSLQLARSISRLQEDQDVLSTERNWLKDSFQIDSESTAGQRISGSKTGQQANIPVSHSISRLETDQSASSISEPVQTKYTGHAGISSYPQQDRSKNLMKAFMQSHQLSQRQDTHAEENRPENSLPHTYSKNRAGEKISSAEIARQATYWIPKFETDSGIPSISQPHISGRDIDELSNTKGQSLPADMQGSTGGSRKITQVNPGIFRHAPSIGRSGQLLQRSMAKSTAFSGKRFDAGSEMSSAAANIPLTLMDHPVSPGSNEVSGTSNSINSNQIRREHVSIPYRLPSSQGQTIQTQAFKSDVGIPAVQMAYPKQKPIEDKRSASTSYTDVGSIQRAVSTSDSIPGFLDRRSDESFMTIMPAIRETGQVAQVQDQPQEANTNIDIESIAQKVYKIIKRQLAVERERRGVHF